MGVRGVGCDGVVLVGLLDDVPGEGGVVLGMGAFVVLVVAGDGAGGV
jgi:hypothetical protein